jgi:hypothetical protein
MRPLQLDDGVAGLIRGNDALRPVEIFCSSHFRHADRRSREAPFPAETLPELCHRALHSAYWRRLSAWSRQRKQTLAHFLQDEVESDILRTKSIAQAPESAKERGPARFKRQFAIFDATNRFTPPPSNPVCRCARPQGRSPRSVPDGRSDSLAFRRSPRPSRTQAAPRSRRLRL